MHEKLSTDLESSPGTIAGCSNLFYGALCLTFYIIVLLQRRVQLQSCVHQFKSKAKCKHALRLKLQIRMVCCQIVTQ